MNSTPFFNRSNVRKWCWRLLIGLATISFVLDTALLKRYSYFSDTGGIQSMDSVFLCWHGSFGLFIVDCLAKGMYWALGVEETYYHDDF